MYKQIVILFLIFINALSFADTFRHNYKDITYHGYAEHETKNGTNVVVTKEKGPISLNLGEYDIEYNTEGRNNFVSVLQIEDSISLEHATKAFEEAIVLESDKGPLFILIEIDTPGGYVHLCKRLCAAISEVRYCKTVAYIKGGENGGAFSAGAAVSMACDEIYMVPQVSIGAATMLTTNSKGEVADMEKAYGEAIGEKFNSAWRSFLASLAEENHRSGAIAKAMADKDIAVIEVERKGQRLFIETQNKTNDDIIVRTVCRKGELLTLSANEAVSCNFASGIAESRQSLLNQAGFPNADVIESKDLEKAKDEFEKVIRKFNTLNSNLDLKFREILAKGERGTLTRSEALRDYEDIIKSGQYLLKLKQSYPDIPYSEGDLILFVNDVKAQYASIKAMR